MIKVQGPFTNTQPVGCVKLLTGFIPVQCDQPTPDVMTEYSFTLAEKIVYDGDEVTVDLTGADEAAIAANPKYKIL